MALARRMSNKKFTVGTKGDYLIVYACGGVGCRKAETSVKQEENAARLFMESNGL